MCIETHTPSAIEGWDFQMGGTYNRAAFCRFIKVTKHHQEAGARSQATLRVGAKIAVQDQDYVPLPLPLGECAEKLPSFQMI